MAAREVGPGRQGADVITTDGLARWPNQIDGEGHFRPQILGEDLGHAGGGDRAHALGAVSNRAHVETPRRSAPTCSASCSPASLPSRARTDWKWTTSRYTS